MFFPAFDVTRVGILSSGLGDGLGF